MSDYVSARLFRTVMSDLMAQVDAMRAEVEALEARINAPPQREAVEREGNVYHLPGADEA